MEKQFNTLIESEDLKEITTDIVEAVLDSNITDDVVKEIPIVKTLISLRKIYTSISDSIFIKKTMHVLFELGDINWKQRTDLISDLDDDNGSGVDKILMAIDKIESIEKSKVFGRLCKLKALNKMSKDEFLRLTKLIQDSYLKDFDLIHEWRATGEDSWEIHEGDYYQILILGLIHQEEPYLEESHKGTFIMEKQDEPEPLKIKTKYSLTSLGLLLLKHINELFPDRW